jgi:hypothetical protein
MAILSLGALVLGVLPACAQQDTYESVMADCGGHIPGRMVDSCLERARVLDETMPSQATHQLVADLSARVERIRDHRDEESGGQQAYGGPDGQGYGPPPGQGGPPDQNSGEGGYGPPPSQGGYGPPPGQGGYGPPPGYGDQGAPPPDDHGRYDYSGPPPSPGGRNDQMAPPPNYDQDQGASPNDAPPDYSTAPDDQPPPGVSNMPDDQPPPAEPTGGFDDAPPPPNDTQDDGPAPDIGPHHSEKPHK